MQRLRTEKNFFLKANNTFLFVFNLHFLLKATTVALKARKGKRVRRDFSTKRKIVRKRSRNKIEIF